LRECSPSTIDAFSTSEHLNTLEPMEVLRVDLCGELCGRDQISVMVAEGPV
jgi:hypothetical protein